MVKIRAEKGQRGQMKLFITVGFVWLYLTFNVIYTLLKCFIKVRVNKFEQVGSVRV